MKNKQYNWAGKSWLCIFFVIMSPFFVSGQQIGNMNLTFSNGAPEINLIPPTDINSNGTVLSNQVILYELDPNEDGAAEWRTNDFTADEAVLLKLTTLGSTTSSYIFSIQNDDAQMGAETNGQTILFPEDVVLLRGSENIFRIEREGANYKWLVNGVELKNEVGDANVELHATITVSTTSQDNNTTPSVYFSFPESITPSGGTGCTNPSNLALSGIFSSSGANDTNEPLSNINNGSTNYPGAKIDWAQNAWVEVDLGEIYDLTTTDIWNTGGSNNQFFIDYKVFISNEEFSSTDIQQTIDQFGVTTIDQDVQAGRPTTLAINRTGRYLRIQLVGAGLMNIDEWIINGCPTSIVPTPIDTKVYTTLRKELDGSYVNISNGRTLNFQYIEDYAIVNNENDKITCKVYDWTRTVQYSTELDNEYGVNWQNLTFPQSSQISDDTFYVLEVEGANKGEKYYLRIKTGCLDCQDAGGGGNGGD